MRRYGRLVRDGPGPRHSRNSCFHTLLSVTDHGLVSTVQGQTKPSTSAQTNGTRGAKPYTTWTTYSGGAHRRSIGAHADQQGERVAARGGVDVPGAGTVIFNP
jgi:hypothetical protein